MLRFSQQCKGETRASVFDVVTLCRWARGSGRFEKGFAFILMNRDRLRIFKVKATLFFTVGYHYPGWQHDIQEHKDLLS
jgi:hypothetical protein